MFDLFAHRQREGVISFCFDTRGEENERETQSHLNVEIEDREREREQCNERSSKKRREKKK